MSITFTSLYCLILVYRKEIDSKETKGLHQQDSNMNPIREDGMDGMNIF